MSGARERILVTGGAGFIGSHLVEEFLRSGAEILVIDDLSSGLRKNLSSEVRLEVLDIGSEGARKVVREFAPHIVVHAAAQISVRRSMEEPVFDVSVNVGGMVNLLQSLNDLAYPHVVFISTGGAIYGEQESFPAPEDHPVRPASVYGLSKRVAELYLEFWKRERGLTFTALRLGNVYGPRQNPHGEAGVVAIFSERLLQGKPCTIYGDGTQTRDFVYVKDVSRAVQLAARKRVEGVFNIGTGRETSVNELFAGIATSLNLAGVKPLYGPARAGEQHRSVIDPGRAWRKFEWKPDTPIEEGLRLTASWYRQGTAPRG